jgi:hypothetical protein
VLYEHPLMVLSGAAPSMARARSHAERPSSTCDQGACERWPIKKYPKGASRPRGNLAAHECSWDGVQMATQAIRLLASPSSSVEAQELT